MSFAMVPIVVPYLGQERFGIWISLSSILGLLAFADLGLGIGLQNKLSECYAHSDLARASQIISSGFAGILVLTLLFSSIGLTVLSRPSVISMLSSRLGGAADEALIAAKAALLGFAIGMPSGLIQRIYNAYQIGYKANVTLAIGTLLSFVAICLCALTKQPLPILILSITLPPALVLFYPATKYLQRFGLRVSKIHLNILITLSRTGSQALGAQLANALITSGPLLVLVNTSGPASVVPFSLSQRLLGSFTVLLIVILSSLWPAYAEAIAVGDYAWVRSTFARICAVALAFALLIGSVVLMGGQIFILWWSQDARCVPSHALLLVCVTWMVLNIWTSLCTSLLNSASRMLGQATYGFALGLLALSVLQIAIHKHDLSTSLWMSVIPCETLRAVVLSFEVKALLQSLRQSAIDRRRLTKV